MNGLPTTWLAETLLATTLLMVVVLLLRNPVARVFGPRVSYLLWLLPALRMILPPLPEQQIEAPVGIGLSVIDGISRSLVVAEAPPTALASSFDWVGAMLAIWVVGALLYFLWHLVAYHRFLVKTDVMAQPISTVAGIAVYSADVTCPAATGIMRRRVLLPQDFTTRFDAGEQHLALSHELAHHRRGDLIANWAALLILSLHWYNPVAHMAYRAFRADQELACDATVLATSAYDKRHAYASAIVKATWSGSIIAACPLNHAGQLKRRLKMMSFEHKSLVRTASGVVVTVALVGGCLVATASATVTAPVVSHAIQTLASKAPVFMAQPHSTDVSAIDAPVTVVDEIIPEPVASQSAMTLVATSEAHEEIGAVDASLDAPAKPVRAIGYRTAGSTVRQYVLPASKALFISLLEGRGPDAEPLQVQNVILHGLAPEEIQLLADISRRAGNVSAAVEAINRLDSSIFEAAPVGSGSFIVDVSRKPAPTVTSVDIPALLSESSIKSAVLKARRELDRAPAGSDIRDVYAIVVPGTFNGEEPGKAYVGFCGEIRFRPGQSRAFGAGGGRLWSPFFVSATPSSINGLARRLFIADSRVTERCAGARSPQAYTSYFIGVGPSYPSSNPTSYRRSIFSQPM